MYRYSHMIVIPVLAAFIFSLGCAQQKQAPGPVRADYYPACHEPLAYLEERNQGATATAVAGGAIQGGVITGIAAAIVGAIAGGIRPAGILTSIGVGAAVGGATGAISQHGNNAREDNKRLAAYLEQIDGDIEGLDIVGAAATVSMQCYGREFRTLIADLKSKKITRDAAQKRFAEILAGREEAAKLLNKPSDAAAYEKEFNAAAS